MDRFDQLDRRKFLKKSGTVAASMVLAGCGSSNGKQQKTRTYARSTENVDLRRIDEDEQREISLDSNGTLKNTVIDITADGADVNITTTGDNWTISNVGICGSSGIGTNTDGFPNVIYARGNGVIEDVYIGDGVAADGIRKGGIGIAKSHSGHITIRNCYIARWTGSGIYAAHAAEPSGNGGSIGMEGCYLRDNTISHVRIAQGDSYMKSCIIHNTNNVPSHPVNNGTRISRGIWSLYGDSSQVVDVYDCHIDINPTNTATPGPAVLSVNSEPMSRFRLVGCNIRGAIRNRESMIIEGLEHSPNTQTPTELPTTPKEAVHNI